MIFSFQMLVKYVPETSVIHVTLILCVVIWCKTRLGFKYYENTNLKLLFKCVYPVFFEYTFDV
jgi:hypothetical protein